MAYVYDDGCCPHGALHECAPCPPVAGIDVERLARALHAIENHDADTPNGPTCWRCVDRAAAIADALDDERQGESE